MKGDYFMAQLIIYPKSDAYVSENTPTTNFGTDISIITGQNGSVGSEKNTNII